jgi:hypothetical protein
MESVPANHRFFLSFGLIDISGADGLGDEG